MNKEEVVEEIAMPHCPYCKVAMTPKYFTGYYESFSMWECDCSEIPGAEESHGCYA